MRNVSPLLSCVCLSSVCLVCLPGCLELTGTRQTALALSSKADLILVGLASIAEESEKLGDESKEEWEKIIEFAESAQKVSEGIVDAIDVIEEVAESGLKAGGVAGELVLGGGGLLSLAGVAYGQWRRLSGYQSGRSDQTKEEERRSDLLVKLAQQVNQAHPETKAS